jgi:hypothetical protein
LFAFGRQQPVWRFVSLSFLFFRSSAFEAGALLLFRTDFFLQSADLAIKTTQQAATSNSISCAEER